MKQEQPIFTQDIEEAALLMLAGHEFVCAHRTEPSTELSVCLRFELDRLSNDKYRAEMKGRTTSDTIAEIYKMIDQDVPEVSGAGEIRLNNGNQNYFIAPRISGAFVRGVLEKRFHSLF